MPSAQANLAKIPDDVTDEQVVLLADIASTGFAGAESGGVRIGDTVVVFAQGPIGLCATAGAKLMGAAQVIGVDSDPVRLAMARRMGADVALDFTKVDVVEEVKRLTRGYGADVAIEALGTQQTFESALRTLRPGGTLSSLGVYSGKLELPYAAFAAGLGDHRIVTTLCPGGKERMGRLIAMVQAGRFDPTPLHHAPLRAERHRGGLPALQQPPGRRPEGRDHPVAKPPSHPRLAGPTGRPVAFAPGRGPPGALPDNEVVRQGLSGCRIASSDQPDELVALTQQERKILALVAESMTNKEIAAELFLSDKTVKNYVSSVLAKLNLERRAQAAAYDARIKSHPVD